ncbi:hypothetical protein [Pseudonocardia sp. EV170527-09]|uniref:hypothetical protein n=1 Tax=Pseudonocardia sp. EV170527-09 TaxID=2603411 RepID=UPI0013866C35|nr:hypothetical protein [Pseudonocardia sp. EV170527-09]
MAWQPSELVVVTRLAGRKVTAHCELVAMARLRPGDLFLGLNPGQPVMRVQVARSVPSGALAVFDESGTADQRWAAVRRGDVEPGAKPGEGFFPRSTVRVTSVKRVLRFTR